MVCVWFCVLVCLVMFGDCCFGGFWGVGFCVVFFGIWLLVSVVCVVGFFVMFICEVGVDVGVGGCEFFYYFFSYVDVGCVVVVVDVVGIVGFVFWFVVDLVGGVFFCFFLLFLVFMIMFFDLVVVLVFVCLFVGFIMVLEFGVFRFWVLLFVNLMLELCDFDSEEGVGVGVLLLFILEGFFVLNWVKLVVVIGFEVLFKMVLCVIWVDVVDFFDKDLY